MRVTGLNHVSISSVDVETSVRFYVEVLGLEPIDTYTFAFPTRYLRLGDVQLHVFQRENTDAPPFHHIGLNIDDFEGAYKRAKELDMLDREAFYSPIWELPDGTVQLYLRDPGGNLVELDWPDVTTIDRERVPDIRKLEDSVPQTAEAVGATLYLGPSD